MKGTPKLGGIFACIAALTIGCSSPSGPDEAARASAPAAEPAPAPSQATPPVALPEAPPAETAEPAALAVTPVEPAPAQPASTSTGPAPAPTPSPAAPEPVVPKQVAPAPAAPVPAATQPPATTSAPAPAPAPAAAPTPAKAVVDPGGVIAVAATKPGLRNVGSDTCEMCHEVQFTSWSQTAHASRTPPLDCEGCHGPGSEYKANSVMKDPAKAKAAGLVIPDASFCSKCHVKGVTDALLKRVHAHEE